MSRTDKSTSTPTTPTTPIPPNVTKLCHIIKRPDFDGYGFNLHSEKVKPGQFIGKVDPNSPAEEAGLKEGDRIIEVNGVPIGSDTHKQVVQRIKAISCEVRLLLIDVDGKGDAPKTPNSAKAVHAEIKPATPTTPPPAMPPTNGNDDEEYHGTKQELPGESANISSISMVSTKRISNTSASSSNHSSADVVDRGAMHNGNGNGMLMMPMPDLTNGIMEKQQQQENAKPVPHNNNNNNSNNINNNMKAMTITTPPSTPPPPATVVAAAGVTPAYSPAASPKMQEKPIAVNVPPPPSAITATNANNNNNNNNTMTTMNANGNGIGIGIAATTMQTNANANSVTTTTTSSMTTTTTTNNNSSGVIRAGSLNLPMTAAEMRAKLMSKKKYDPKSESVDLKKKFEIIQKL